MGRVISLVGRGMSGGVGGGEGWGRSLGNRGTAVMPHRDSLELLITVPDNHTALSDLLELSEDLNCVDLRVVKLRLLKTNTTGLILSATKTVYSSHLWENNRLTYFIFSTKSAIKSRQKYKSINTKHQNTFFTRNLHVKRTNILVKYA